ncbi:MAG: hypothetical protein EXS59_02935 [Candidatus Taylorbacteria bacterium]|nr:hypothetical protein [Candidatus Taylorbacteria bacterium]
MSPKSEEKKKALLGQSILHILMVSRDTPLCIKQTRWVEVTEVRVVNGKLFLQLTKKGDAESESRQAYYLGTDIPISDFWDK